SWNTTLLELIKGPRYAESIARVYITSGISEEQTAYAAQDTALAKLNAEAHDFVQMYAMIPDTCVDGVGVGKWLDIEGKYSHHSKTEVTCYPQKILHDCTKEKLLAGIATVAPCFFS
ncbi:hypothetical protein PENTCL1PPCAC_3678, partial [Pristionchus entomophagus]